VSARAIGSGGVGAVPSINANIAIAAPKLTLPMYFR
jgi:hypothetical protein